jgi:hypothetical protein
MGRGCGMSGAPTCNDMIAYMITWGNICSAIADILDNAIEADTPNLPGQILLAQAGIKAVWSEMLDMIVKLDSCTKVKP